jgi:hypothetical protein
MSKVKNTYYAWMSNDNGSSADVQGRTSSKREIEDKARAQFGAGWQAHIMEVQVDGDGQSVMGVEEVKTFRLRK